MILWFVGSNDGRLAKGKTLRIPAGPSTITDLTSLAVAPTRAICFTLPVSTTDLTHSEPVRDFPKPRPAISIHTRHLPVGGFCLSLAQNSYQQHLSSLAS